MFVGPGLIAKTAVVSGPPHEQKLRLASAHCGFFGGNTMTAQRGFGIDRAALRRSCLQGR